RPLAPTCDAVHLSAVVVAARKPPLNQPHVMPRWLNRSPMFFPERVMRLVVAGEQSSSSGRGLPITVPAMTSAFFASWSIEAPCVCPETRLIAPTADDPQFVSKVLSLSA